VGIQIPGELADLLNDLGYTWPEADEEKLFQLGQHWLDYSGAMQQAVQDAAGSAAKVWSDNRGDAVDAFRAMWQAPEAPHAVLADGVTAATVIGGCLFLCAAVVLALKINVIVQLTILLIEIIQAVATAPETFGGSLLEIPVFKKLCDLAVNFIISKAMEAVLG
jgi:hypothetical protein